MSSSLRDRKPFHIKNFIFFMSISKRGEKTPLKLHKCELKVIIIRIFLNENVQYPCFRSVTFSSGLPLLEWVTVKPSGADSGTWKLLYDQHRWVSLTDWVKDEPLFSGLVGDGGGGSWPSSLSYWPVYRHSATESERRTGGTVIVIAKITDCLRHQRTSPSLSTKRFTI